MDLMNSALQERRMDKNLHENKEEISKISIESPDQATS
jgi:hypothetical protein